MENQLNINQKSVKKLSLQFYKNQNQRGEQGGVKKIHQFHLQLPFFFQYKSNTVAMGRHLVVYIQAWQE